jgi:RNA polymerase sigma-70 factor (ECF subfamily)
MSADQFFESTEWSVVLTARGAATPAASEALARLCRAYWAPLHAFIRRRGHVNDAEDLTQEFFAHLLAPEFLRGVDPSRGKFRAFLLASCKNFLVNEAARAGAQRRGGGRAHVSIDRATLAAVDRPVDGGEMTPEAAFDLEWARTLLARALDRLREEFARSDRAGRFDALRPLLDGDEGSYAEAARRLGASEATVRTAAHRLRKDFRRCLLAEIAETVSSPSLVEEELRDLFVALGSPGADR